MQDYSSLGITSILDRKKLFQLVQSLRQEIPTLENGLVSSASSKYSRFSKSPQTSNVPDLTNLNITAARRGSGQPPPQQLQQIPTRSRSRTLPSSDHHRPEFLKSNSNNNFFNEETTTSLSDSDDSDDSEKCEIRRGSGPLLDPYGVPIQNKLRYSAIRNQSQSMTPTSVESNHTGNTTTTTATSSNSITANAALASPLTSIGSPLQQSQQLMGQSDLNQKIRVCVRKRPLNKKELERAEKDIAPTAGVRSINVNEPKMKVDLTRYIEQHSFTFDDVFDSDETNEKIYSRTAQPLVKYVFDGGKATCFAYGQTGSGKTYTMLDPKLGLYVLAARDVFSLIQQAQYEHLSAWIGFYEIYQGQLYDLLNSRKKLFAREDGKQNVVIVGLKEFVIKNVQDLMQVFEYGSQARSTGSTGANSDSSRSHAVLQILLRPTKNKKKIIGKLSFIDLAGSERGADRGDTDMKTRMEGAEINKSLLALKECIRALDQDKRHTPFRQSKLTQVLKDSFVGNSRTCMIATISPNQSNSEHTLNTLRYADRVKELKGERDRRVVGSDNNNDSLNLTHQRHLSSEEYPIEDEYPNEYPVSDDSDLYNNVEDDDLLLHDEDFPSDGDGNILDEDFIHENRYDHHQQQQQQLYMRSPPLPPPPAAAAAAATTTTTTADAAAAAAATAAARVADQRYHRPPFDVPPMASSPDYMFEQSQQQQYQFQLQQQQQQPPPKTDDIPNANDFTAQLEDCLFFDPNTIESFIKFHRAQIREVTEFSKKETKLLANFSLGLSSRREDERQTSSSSLREELKTSSEFIGYLDNLDELLEMKTAAIEALRDRIRLVLGEEEL
ncbi:P-loop containing nucleoside triphosphate hydrolase protein [Parasitella parasitica]|nr:P-loop containing nucleoside triphosphate hydrolase protein [Parasitella parasitica]